MAAEPGPVTDDTGCCQLIASASFDQVISPHVVVIGGTLSMPNPDQRVLQWLRQVHPATTWTTSVCTGPSTWPPRESSTGKMPPPTEPGPESWNAAAPTTPSSWW